MKLNEKKLKNLIEEVMDDYEPEQTVDRRSPDSKGYNKRKELLIKKYNAFKNAMDKLIKQDFPADKSDRIQASHYASELGQYLYYDYKE